MKKYKGVSQRYDTFKCNFHVKLIDFSSTLSAQKKKIVLKKRVSVVTEFYIKDSSLRSSAGYCSIWILKSELCITEYKCIHSTYIHAN